MIFALMVVLGISLLAHSRAEIRWFAFQVFLSTSLQIVNTVNGKCMSCKADFHKNINDDWFMAIIYISSLLEVDCLLFKVMSLFPRSFIY